VNVEQKNQFWLKDDFRLSQEFIGNVNMVSRYCLQVGCTSHFNDHQYESFCLKDRESNSFSNVNSTSWHHPEIWVMPVLTYDPWFEVLTVIMVRIQVLWDVMVSLGEWFLVFYTKPLTQWHGITSQKTQTLISTLITWKIWHWRP
jgi:hypothetical protein